MKQKLWFYGMFVCSWAYARGYLWTRTHSLRITELHELIYDSPKNQHIDRFTRVPRFKEWHSRQWKNDDFRDKIIDYTRPNNVLGIGEI